MKTFWPRAVLVVLLTLVLVNVVSAAGADALSQQAKSCDDNVSYFRNKIDGVVAWTNVCLILGAITAALGSACAGFLPKDGLRKAAALLGALGAVLTVIPKTLADKDTLQAHLAAAEKHRVLGSKVRNQLAFARPDESVIEAQKYASARFTDCASVDPPAAAPDLPAPVPVPLATSVSASLPAEEPAIALSPTAAPQVAPAPSLSAGKLPNAASSATRSVVQSRGVFGPAARPAPRCARAEAGCPPIGITAERL
jgi:hypothetical protein